MFNLNPTATNDDERLALLGKKQQLKRRFGFWSLFGFAVCELITWETVLALFSQAFENGGPAGAVYGFIIAWSSTFSVYTVISELASMSPVACGQYYWVYILAPPKWKVFCSYIIGWLVGHSTILLWHGQLLRLRETIFAGTILQGLLILDYPDYDAQRYQGTLLAWAIVFLCVFVNTIVPGMLPKFEIFIIVFHLAGFVAIVAVLWKFAPHSSSRFVWLTAFNEGGWPTQGLSYCVGFLGNVATFVGADASVHMAEEVSNAAVTIPRAILASMLINGAVGFTMMLTVLYCIGPDVDSVLESATGYPFIQVFYNAVSSRAGATVMGAVVLSLTIACSIGILTTSSRMVWSFARDRGTPFSNTFSKVAKHNQVPIIAVVVVAVIAGLLQLIYIGSSVAFNDVVSLTITGFYSSYFLPSAMLLYRRVKGQVAPYVPTNAQPTQGYDPEVAHQAVSTHGGTTQIGNKDLKDQLPDESPTLQPSAPRPMHRDSLALEAVDLVWGPFHVPGIFGIINNAYACCYMIFVIFWSVWPPATPVTAETMNYSIVVTGGVIIFSIIWYYIKGRKEYKGPVVDDEVVAQVQRRGSVQSISRG